MDDRLDAHWWIFTAQIGRIKDKKRVERYFVRSTWGIERLSGVQMLPQKSFYLKVLEGGQGREKSYLIWEFATQSVQTQCATN